MKKTGLIPKIILLSIFLSVFIINIAAQKVTLSFQNVPFEKVLNSIKQQTGLALVFSEQLVDVNRRVSIDVSSIEVNAALTQLLTGTNVGFEIKNKKLYLIEKKEKSDSKVGPRKITGLVTDSKGEPIIGAAIKLNDSNTGTVSDTRGRFNLEVNDQSVLEISYIGYLNETVKVASKDNIFIRLKENSKKLDEVVVIGYGTQKKINLTGSISSVSSDFLKMRPIANATTGLEGALSGVTIVNSTGRPGDNNTTIRIRGVGTLNNSDPLVLIDGIEGNMNILNPDDIESVSVLKDAASSSIYGSRAANGVILVTTKNVKKDVKPTINYTGYYASQTPTRTPKMLDAVTYLTLLKEATQNVNKNWGYTDADILAIQDGSDPNYHANTNWVNELYKQNAPQQAHNVSLNGGSKTMGYYASYGYLSTDGLLVGNGYHSARNNIRLKVNTELFDRLTIEGNVGYTDVDNWTPASSDSESGGLFYSALRSSPLVPVHFTDGQWGYGGSSFNPVAVAYDGGFINYKSRQTTLNLSSSFKIFEGLIAKVQFGTRLTDVLRKQQSNIIEHFYPDTNTHLAYSSSTSALNQRATFENYQSLIAQLDYDKKINQHYIHVLTGFSQEYQIYNQMDAGRQDLVSNDLHVLNAGTTNQTNSGYANQWAIRSGFGRVNYNFSDRYLVEGDIRYDLSSRFYKDNRGGFFPSASVAWRMSEESFMHYTKNWLDNFKFRASCGSLGNQYTSTLYPYISTIGSTSTIMPIGTAVTTAMQQSVASNNTLSWESILMYNAGFDISLFNNRLSINGDYYIKNTNGILLTVNLPDVLGVSEPYQNAGKVQNKGWEVSISWRDKIGKDVSYGLKGNLSDVINKVTSMGNTASDFSADQIRAVGYPIDAFWGYVANGLATVNDFDYNSTTNTYTPKSTFPIMPDLKTKIQPGDIKYKDLDGDGKITATGDRTYIGSPIPRYTFSVGGDVEWKGLDLQMYFQGVGKCDGYIKGSGRNAFTDIANYPQEVHLGRWTWDNQNSNASYPRLTYGETYNQNYLSTYWLEDASYLRLKNIQVGYTFPKSITSKLSIDKCRIYFSGENLYTFTKFFYAYDPEVPVSSGGYYPVVKTMSLGLSLTFN